MVNDDACRRDWRMLPVPVLGQWIRLAEVDSGPQPQKKNGPLVEPWCRFRRSQLMRVSVHSEVATVDKQPALPSIAWSFEEMAHGHAMSRP